MEQRDSIDRSSEEAPPTNTYTNLSSSQNGATATSNIGDVSVSPITSAAASNNSQAFDSVLRSDVRLLCLVVLKFRADQKGRLASIPCSLA